MERHFHRARNHREWQDDAHQVSARTIVVFGNSCSSHNLLHTRCVRFRRFLTNPKIGGMSKDGKPFGTSIASQKTKSTVYKSPKFKIDGVSISVKLRDTAGFETTANDALMDVPQLEKIRGCILVHKRGRGWRDFEQTEQIFRTMGLEFKQHLLVFVTHTGNLSDSEQHKYSDAIQQENPEVPADRIIHVNVAHLEDSNEGHGAIDVRQAQSERARIFRVFQAFDDEIAPASKGFGDYIDRSYDTNLNRKGGSRLFCDFSFLGNRDRGFLVLLLKCGDILNFSPIQFCKG